MSDCGCGITAEGRKQQRTLVTLLAINTVMFLIEFGIGIISESTALIADAMDMLADAMVYGLGLYAVGRAAATKIKAASFSGVFQVFLGIAVAAEIVRRALFGSEPEPLWMMAIGMAALVANTVCLALIARHRHGEIHMRASWIFSRNDVIANVAVIIAGAMVHYLSSFWPDLLIGSAISILVMHGGIRILKEARRENGKE